MADLAEVVNAIIDVIGQFIFPTAYTPYSVATSKINGIAIRLARGYPNDNQLNTDLLANIVTITVNELPGVQRNTTRFLRQNAIYPVSIADVTMTATKSGNTITFAGSTSVSEVIGVAIVPTAGFSMRLLSNDTPTTVATRFAANLPNATSTGPVLTINTSLPIRVDVGADTTVLNEVGRQEQMFCVDIWAPNSLLRDQVAGYIDPLLRSTDHLMFSDGSASGPIKTGNGTVQDDQTQKQHLWKRKLFYMCEYSTTISIVTPPMVLGSVTAGGPVYFE